MPEEEDEGLKCLSLNDDYRLVSPTVTQEDNLNTSEKIREIKKIEIMNNNY